MTIELALFALSLLVLGTLLAPNAGEGRMLELICGKTAQADLVLILFSNDVTPVETTVLADLTEVTGGGYGAKTLTGANWTVTPGAPSSMAYAEQTFTFTSVPGVATVYGYAVKHGTVLLWAERLPDAPFVIATAGDEIRVTPQFTQE